MASESLVMDTEYNQQGKGKGSKTKKNQVNKKKKGDKANEWKGRSSVRFPSSRPRFRSLSRGRSSSNRRSFSLGRKKKVNDKSADTVDETGVKQRSRSLSARGRMNRRSLSLGRKKKNKVDAKTKQESERGIDPDGIVLSSTKDQDVANNKSKAARRSRRKSKKDATSVSSKRSATSSKRSVQSRLKAYDDGSDTDVSFIERELFALPEKLVAKGTGWFTEWANALPYDADRLGEEDEEDEEEHTDTGASDDTDGEMTDGTSDDGEMTNEESYTDGTYPSDEDGNTVNVGWFSNWIGNDTAVSLKGGDDAAREDADGKVANAVSSPAAEENTNNLGWITQMTNYFADDTLKVDANGFMTEVEEGETSVDERDESPKDIRNCHTSHSSRRRRGTSSNKSTKKSGTAHSKKSSSTKSRGEGKRSSSPLAIDSSLVRISSDASYIMCRE